MANPTKIYQRNSFSGGMNYFADPTTLQDNEYPLCFNARTRFNNVTPVKAPVKIASLSGTGNGSQGLFAAGNLALAFVNGVGYYRDFNDTNNPNFSRIDNLMLSPTAPEVFAEIVPASTINYKRSLDGSDASDPVRLVAGTIARSPAAVVIQDGVSQPWIVLSNGQARRSQTYEQWSDDYREYVPIGKQMLFKDGVLYTVSSDGLQIFRSVTGRPVDYMVVVDTNGNKLTSELEGGAQTVSHAVSYDPITSISNINTADSSFFVGTKRGCFYVIPDFTDTIYGEPTFGNRQFVTGTGPINNRSFLPDVNGDSCFIDTAGVRSFNSIAQFRLEGKNSPFSLNISKLFQLGDTLLTQTATACGQFDNYSLFAVTTIFGPAVLWFDELRGVWDSIEIYNNIAGSIVQFATIKTDSNRFLLFRTDTGEFYQWGASANTIGAKIYIGEFIPSAGAVVQDIGNVRVVMNNVFTAGTFTATPYVDQKLQYTLNKSVAINNDNPTNGVIVPPFGLSNKRTVTNLTFDFGRAEQGWKTGIWFEWDFNGTFKQMSIESVPSNNVTSFAEQMQNSVSNNEFFKNRQ